MSCRSWPCCGRWGWRFSDGGIGEEPAEGIARGAGMVAGRAGGAPRSVATDGQCDRDGQVRPQPSAGFLPRADVQAANRRNFRSGPNPGLDSRFVRLPGKDLIAFAVIGTVIVGTMLSARPIPVALPTVVVYEPVIDRPVPSSTTDLGSLEDDIGS